jgi:hypothetical protein
VDEIVRNINDPSNAFNAQTDCHDYYDDLSWGIEAQVQHDGNVSETIVGTKDRL